MQSNTDLYYVFENYGTVHEREIYSGPDYQTALDVYHDELQSFTGLLELASFAADGTYCVDMCEGELP